ncbi:hypothetical protein GL58_04180 [Comamonas testosteroni]|uniref:Uncharacterized protein n=1 Tax=Comamonas testosteroni TaxID=285 RepID=A0A0L7MQF5_COMTE|nr:hypothetical protein GL58_04180 [Comamonas testosteroni]
MDFNGIKARNRAVAATKDQRQFSASECYTVNTFTLLQILNDGNELLVSVRFDQIHSTVAGHGLAL